MTRVSVDLLHSRFRSVVFKSGEHALTVSSEESTQSSILSQTLVIEMYILFEQMNVFPLFVFKSLASVSLV